MYKHQMPAEYLARQALRERMASDQVDQRHENPKALWRRDQIRKVETIPTGRILVTHFTDDLRKAA